jgi:transcriptional regulator with GAF, ATPase, and Fis domain
MSIDQDDFFRQVTMRITGSLDIEIAMYHCLQYLKGILPADAMFMNLYDAGIGAARTIATATASRCTKTDQVLPLSREARTRLEGENLTDIVTIINRPAQHPVGRDIIKFFSNPDWSLLVMRFVIEGRRVGGFTLSAKGQDQYSQEHARLFALLNQPFAIAIANALRHQEVIKLKDLVTEENRYLHQELLRQSGDQIIGSELGLKGTMEMAAEVAKLNTPVLLLGETGVGKDLIANAIHNWSPRRGAALIKVNCGAIPDGLIDSELFGHEKGAFTGATDKKRGRFERAHNGTIFLDEIGELPPKVQVRMLRVLQHKEIERVGGTKSIPIDVRIIAATHRNIEEMVSSQVFREDLWFRLNVFPITIPPLRKRIIDIPALVHHLIGRKSAELKLHSPPQLAPGAIDRLKDYRWPGNIRELENIVERALILNKGEPLAFDRFILSTPTSGPADLPDSEAKPLKLDEVVSRHIQQVLRMAKGKVRGPGGVAELLGVNSSTIRNRMKKLGIPYGRRVNRQEKSQPT